MLYVVMFVRNKYIFRVKIYVNLYFKFNRLSVGIMLTDTRSSDGSLKSDNFTKAHLN